MGGGLGESAAASYGWNWMVWPALDIYVDIWWIWTWWEELGESAAASYGIGTG